MTSRKSKAFSNTEDNIKQPVVRLDRNFLLRHQESRKEITTSSESNENESKQSDRNIAKGDSSKKHKVLKLSDKDSEDSDNESEENYRNVTKKNVSMKSKRFLSLKTKESSTKNLKSDRNEKKERNKNVTKKIESKKRKVLEIDIVSSGNESAESDSNMAQKKLSKKHKVSKRSQKDAESSDNESDGNVTKKSASKKHKVLEVDVESSGNESAMSDRNTPQGNVSKKHKVSKRLEKDEESNESDGNVTRENASKTHKASKRQKKVVVSSGDESAKNMGLANTLEKSQNDSESSESKENDVVHGNKPKTSERQVKRRVNLSEIESSDSESETSKTNKEKQLKLNKEKIDEANRKGIACKICDEMFKTYNSFASHPCLCKTASVFRCPSCKEKFKHRTSLINHQRREHPERECYPCEFPGCDDSFRTKAKRREHEKFHCKYMCRFCKKRYAKKIYMRQHVKEVHPSKI